MKTIPFKINSINNRVIFGAIIVVSLFTLLTGFTLSQSFYKSAYSSLKERLTGQIYLLMADRQLNTIKETDTSHKLVVDILNREQGLSAFITQTDGSILWCSSESTPEHLPPQHPQFMTDITHGKKLFQIFEVNNKEYIGLSIAIFWNLDNRQTPLVYHVSNDLNELKETVARYQESLWTNLFFMSVTLLISLFVILRWGLKPLRDVEQEIKAVEQGEQDALEQNYPEELKPLTQNINELIHFERQQQERYQNALADLAHSLKTPLAIIQGQTFDPHNPQPYIQQVDDSVQRINNIVEYQLQRATTHSSSAHIRYLSLEPVTQSILDSMKKIYQDKAIHFTTHITSGARFKISEGNFMEITGNLLDNACKWCQNRIEVDITTKKGMLDIQVQDNGPGIDTSQMAAITDRGVRMDERTPGHGVGLAIVQDIVSAYNGHIEFSRSELGGLKIHIQFRQ